MAVFRIENKGYDAFRWISEFTSDTAPGLTRSLVDPAAINALAQVVAGPIDGWQTLEAAEYAVRAIVFHDDPVIVAPYFDAESYRPNNQAEPFRYSASEKTSTSAIQPLIQSANMSTTIIMADRALITASSAEEERALLERFNRTPQRLPPAGVDFYFDASQGELNRLADTPDHYFTNYFPQHPKLVQAYLQKIAPVGSPLYFAAPHYRQELSTYPENRGGSFFRTLDLEWNQMAESWAVHGIGPVVPPLLHIVMTRAVNRQAIVDEIIALRGEMSSPRAQLWALFDSVLQIPDLDTVTRFIQRIESDMKSIIPEAMQARSGKNVFRFLFNWGKAAASWAAGGNGLPEGFAVPRINLVDAARVLKSELMVAHDFKPCLARHLDDPELRALSMSNRDIDIYRGRI